MEHKDERYTAFKQRAAGFLHKNGFTLVLALCVLVIGIAAAATFAPAPAPTPLPSDTAPARPASQSEDETLRTALNSPAPTVPPAVTSTQSPAQTPDEAPAAAPKAPVKAAPPVRGEILWDYAADALLYSVTLEQWTTHPGVDIAAKEGTEVHCVLGGTVRDVYEDDALGMCVMVEHEKERESLYANLQQTPPVKAGQKIEAGDVLGLVGNTASSECMMDSHLHFGFFVKGEPQDPGEFVLLGE